MTGTLSFDPQRLRPLPEAPGDPLPGVRDPRTALRATPVLGGPRRVFPVLGGSPVADTFGAARADVAFHHGDDLFGRLGQPVVAVADGIVFSVGWNRVGGLRLWLRDAEGNEFYYAHLSGYPAGIRNGVPVKAGQPIGYMGDTGDAEGTPTHLHFEVHPAAYLRLGYDGAVDPTGYLDQWRVEPAS
jgi:murein DD-endopeptidase MepM/ murein hydrolase activator NlpD